MPATGTFVTGAIATGASAVAATIASLLGRRSSAETTRTQQRANDIAARAGQVDEMAATLKGQAEFADRLQTQVGILDGQLTQAKAECAACRAETADLRRELTELRAEASDLLDRLGEAINDRAGLRMLVRAEVEEIANARWPGDPEGP